MHILRHLRNFSRKTVYLDELMRIPVLRASEMSPDQLATVSAHRPPLSPIRMFRVLSTEFNAPVTKTDWSKYKDPVVEQELQIARQLISETLLTWRKRADKCPQDWRQLGKFVSDFIEQEGQKLYEEMQSGDTSRWSGKEFLYGEWLNKLNDKQLEMTQGAFKELASTPRIHPLIKKEILGHICEIVSKV